MSWLSSIGIDLCRPSSGGGGTPTPTPSIGTPVLTQTSTAGATPFTWSLAEDATFMPGYYWHVARATGASTAAATTALLASSLNGEAIQQITVGDLADTSTIVFTDLTATPSGPLALRMQVGIEDGLGSYTWGSWSNVLTDTIAVAASTFSTTNKSSYGVLSGSNLVWSYDNATGQAAVGVCTSTSKSSGKVEIGFIPNFNGATGFVPGINIGVSLATQDFTSGFPQPGRSNSAGLNVLCSPHGDMDVYQGAAYLTTVSGSVATSSDLRLLIDIPNKLLWVKLNGTAANGNPAAGTGGIDISSWLTGAMVAWVAPEGDRSITLVPSPTSLTSGFTAWG